MAILTDKKTEEVAKIIQAHFESPLTKMLVVGCGSGLEAAILAQRLHADVVGVDMDGTSFDAEASQFAELEVGDAMALPFDDGAFDFVYSYHALEHIRDPMRALSEMRRVLRPGGGYWIGTPNRIRLLGYVGSKRATLKQKVLWNCVDWKARLRGRFRNELGAHAGFSSKELNQMLSDVFPRTQEMSDLYYQNIYRNRPGLMRFLKQSKLSSVAYPGVYFMGSTLPQ